LQATDFSAPRRFDLIEPLLAGRVAAMGAAGSATGAADALAAAAAAARAAGSPGDGLALIRDIKIACAKRAAEGGAAASAGARVSAQGAGWRDEEASLLWADGQYELALGLARALVDTRSREAGLESTLRRAALLSTMGGWLAERHDESASCICSEYFEHAVALLGRARVAHPREAARLDAALCRAHFQLAKFLDSVQRGCARSTCARVPASMLHAALTRLFSRSVLRNAWTRPNGSRRCSWPRATRPRFWRRKRGAACLACSHIQPPFLP
jgi:hypothetical protein